SLSIGLLFASTILVSGCAEDAHAAEEKKLPSSDAKEVEAPKIVDIDLSDATSNKLLFDLPVFMTFHNNDAKALFVVEKYGRIKRLSKGLESTKEEVTSFLDITDRVL